MKRTAVEHPWARERTRSPRPRWASAALYAGLLLLNLLVMIGFSSGAWNGTFLDLYGRFAPPKESAPEPETEAPAAKQYPPAENWNGDTERIGTVEPIARPGPPIR